MDHHAILGFLVGRLCHAKANLLSESWWGYRGGYIDQFPELLSCSKSEPCTYASIRFVKESSPTLAAILLCIHPQLTSAGASHQSKTATCLERCHLSRSVKARHLTPHQSELCV